MSRDDLTNVEAAFDILLEQIEAEIQLVNRIGSSAFESGNYVAVQEVHERAIRIHDFRDRVAALRREWTELAGPESEQDETPEQHSERRDLGRLQRGLRTPETAYYRPILQTLIERGGQAHIAEILNRVGEIMTGTLRDVDYQPLASDPNLPRWRNAAQWARYTMIRLGFLRADSPRGIWEISEAGKRWLDNPHDTEPGGAVASAPGGLPF